jgi:hypothetical protein
MNVSLFTNLTRTSFTSRNLRNPPNMTAADPAALKAALKNEKAARDFEAMLLTPVLDSLQKTFGGNSEEAKIPGRATIARWRPRRSGRPSRPGAGLALRR